MVTTGFAGYVYARPVLPQDQLAGARENPDYWTIDPSGVVTSFTDIAEYQTVMNGREVTRPARDALYARQIGQVFGAALDDAAQPNLYLAATSAFGLNIVKPDANGDKIPDRIVKGEASAIWMSGQWGFAPSAGAGTIWRVDGATGQVAIFANVTEAGKPNAGPGLGNLAFDGQHGQIFASDLATGIVSRLNMDGAVLDGFDHGQVARAAAGLPAVAYDPALRVEITDPRFDALDPATWGFAPPERRVWGVAVHKGRLYYGVASGKAPLPEVWSVGLDIKTGAFLADVRWEISLDAPLPNLEISDIGFDENGAMVLAQRGARKPSYDFSQMAEIGAAEVLRFTLETPQDDPTTPSAWVAVPSAYAVGFAENQANGAGGLAFGPSYDAEGVLDYSQCSGTLWTTGETLRRNPDVQPALDKGGQGLVNGVQAQPTALLRADNSPPWISYAHDFDGKYLDKPQIGYLGDVAVLGCQNGAGGAVANAAATAPDAGGPPDAPPDGPPLCKGAACIVALCLIDPDLCVPPPPSACAKTSVKLRCDAALGYVADVSYGGSAGNLTQIKLTDPSGQISALPQMGAVQSSYSVPLTGLGAGQVGQINLCAFDAATAEQGAPHDCCNTSVAFKIPSDECQPEVQE